MTKTRRLNELATTIRSKNAGVDHITFDVLFRDEAVYRKVKASGAVTTEAMARQYGLQADKIVNFVFFDPGLAFKFSVRRHAPSGTPGEPDVFGSQMYPPLFDFEIPWDDELPEGGSK